MKKLIVLIGFLILFIVTGFFIINAQSSEAIPVDKEIGKITDNAFDEIVAAFNSLLSMVDWVFVVLLGLLATFINESIESTNIATMFDKLKKLPRGLRTFILAIPTLYIYKYTFEITGRVESFKLWISVMVTMLILSVGINKLMRIAASKFGLKFEGMGTGDKQGSESQATK